MTDAMDEVNRIFARMVGYSAQPRYRYYTRAGSRDRYFYTVEKIDHNGKPRYVAGIYRYMSSKKIWKLVKRSGFAKRYKAKDAAYAYMQKELSEIAAGRRRV